MSKNLEVVNVLRDSELAESNLKVVVELPFSDREMWDSLTEAERACYIVMNLIAVTFLNEKGPQSVKQAVEISKVAGSITLWVRQAMERYLERPIVTKKCNKTSTTDSANTTNSANASNGTKDSTKDTKK